MRNRLFHLMASMCLLSLLVAGANAGSVTLDNSFNNFGYRIEPITADGAFGRSLGIQPDGKILLGGWTVGAALYGAFCAIRLNTNGTLDPAFSDDGIVVTQFSAFNQVEKLLIQSDGKIVLGGTRHFGQNDFAMVRYTTNGVLDTSFNGNGGAASPINGISEDFGKDVVLQTDGKLVMVGSTAADSSSPTAIGIIRRNSNGSLDSSFAGSGVLSISFEGASASADSVLIQESGKIVIGGFVFNGVSNFALLIRLNPNGTIDPTFGNSGLTIVPLDGSGHSMRTLASDSDGKILAGSQNVVLRFSVDGVLDNTFGNDGVINVSHSVLELKVGTNDRFLISGNLGSGVAVSQYLQDGEPDLTFNNIGIVTAIVPGHSCIGSSIVRANEHRFYVGGTCLDSQRPKFAVFSFVESTEPSIAPFDFDGDGKTDVAIFRPVGGGGSGEWWWVNSGNGSNSALQFGLPTDVIAPGDFTGDGKMDITIFRPSSGEWFVLRSEDFSFYSFPFGSAGDTPVTGDYDGDGKADPAVFRPSTSQWFIQRSSDNQTQIAAFGIAGDVPVTADYDGDGKADIAIYRRDGANGAEWWINRSSQGVFAVVFGTATDLTVPGDYTGDGKADIAFFRPSNGTWFVLRSEDFSFFSFPFGAAGDIPSPGDYDGDGKIDAAVFRPSSATWFIQGSTSGTQIQQFGSTGDVPVPSSFVR